MSRETQLTQLGILFAQIRPVRPISFRPGFEQDLQKFVNQFHTTLAGSYFLQQRILAIYDKLTQQTQIISPSKELNSILEKNPFTLRGASMIEQVLYPTVNARLSTALNNPSQLLVREDTCLISPSEYNRLIIDLHHFEIWPGQFKEKFGRQLILPDFLPPITV